VNTFSQQLLLDLLNTYEHWRHMPETIEFVYDRSFDDRCRPPADKLTSTRISENYWFEIRNTETINGLRLKPCTRETLQGTNKQTPALLTTTSIDFGPDDFIRLDSNHVGTRLIIKNN